ncbi:hypothetical protein LC040_03955 [Bacillus tianshenii]|nr:hypothetical protein LC040_03955 [Bacillus tianshenii]
MEVWIRILANMVNDMHDLLLFLSRRLGLHLTDKDLHFWLMGILGMGCFFIVNRIFRVLAKWSIQAVSFTYTVTVLMVIMFAIEIQQKITNRGNMEFADIVVGLWGFIVLFAVYLFILGIFYLGKYVRKKRQLKNDDTMSRQARRKNPFF